MNCLGDLGKPCSRLKIIDLLKRVPFEPLAAQRKLQEQLDAFPISYLVRVKVDEIMESLSSKESQVQEYKIEFHLFESVEQLIEQHQRCKANRAEWDEKDRIYKDHKAREKELENYPESNPDQED